MANGLINLQTDLKSLRYGSEKPYITKDINKPPLSNQIGMQVAKRIDDTSRIAQMLASKPGLKYLANEALLQQVNAEDKINKARKGGKSIVGAILSQVGGTFVNTVKIVGSTLAQVAVNGTGTHFLKGFRTDTYLRPGANEKIPGAFASFFGAGGVEGAQYALRGEIVPTNVQTQFYKEGSTVNNGDIKNPTTGKPSTLSYDAKVFTEDYGTVNTNIINNIPLPEYDANRLAAYNATAGQPIQTQPSTSDVTRQVRNTTVSLGSLGISNINVTGSGLPNSLENIGKTYTSGSPFTGTDTVSNISAIVTSGSNTLAVGTNTDEYGYIQSIANSTSGSTQQDPNFDKATTIYSSGSSYISESQNRKIGDTSKNVVRESRVNLGDQGARKDANKSSNTYWKLGNGTEIDTLNSQDISDDRVPGAAAGRDLAKLYFEVITPEPADSRFLYFRAYIDSFDDGYNASWEARKYVGRAENFYTYGGFDRDITLSFKIAPATRSELKPLYKKMVYLASTTAPTYGTSGLMRGTLVKMTVGSYLDQMPGVITSVKYSLVDGTPWEIAMGQPEGVEADVQVLPMVIQCSISFKPIHNFAPQTGLYNYITSPQESIRFFTEGDKR